MFQIHICNIRHRSTTYLFSPLVLNLEYSGITCSIHWLTSDTLTPWVSRLSASMVLIMLKVSYLPWGRISITYAISVLKIWYKIHIKFCFLKYTQHKGDSWSKRSFYYWLMYACSCLKREQDTAIHQDEGFIYCRLWLIQYFLDFIMPKQICSCWKVKSSVWMQMSSHLK